MTVRHLLLALSCSAAVFACSPTEESDVTAQQSPPAMDLWKEANLRFDPLPAVADSDENPLTEAKIAFEAHG
jgi:hypothetical protein